MWSPEEWIDISKKGLMYAYAEKYHKDMEDGKPRKDVVVVVKASAKPMMNGVFKSIDPISNDDVFTTGLSADGKKPATHYMINWNFCPDFAYKILNGQQNSPNVDLYDTVKEAITDKGLKIIEAEIL